MATMRAIAGSDYSVRKSPNHHMLIGVAMRIVIVILFSFLAACVSATQDNKPPKRIALTFDDAPRGDGQVFSAEERVGALLNALETSQTGPVAFFVTTRGFENEGGRARVLRYAQAGHLIANHSHTHQWLIRAEVDAYLADIDRAEAYLQGLPNRRPWFRFPFLDEGTPREKRDAVRDGLAARGLANGYVTVDNYDWHIDHAWQRALRDGRSVDEAALRQVYVDVLMGAIRFYDEAAIEALGRSPAHVLLLHENDAAAAFIGDLVAALRAEGWEIVSPDEAYADPVAQIVPATLRTRQGHIGALAIEAGRDPRTMSHLAIEEDQIDALIEARGVFGDAP